MRMGIGSGVTTSADAAHGAPVVPSSDLYQQLACDHAPLRIARMQERTLALGPGTRCVVWFQGCSLSCQGCIAASMNAAPPLFLTTPQRLADWCLSLDGVEGITLSGGDPFDQPLDALAELMESVRNRSNLSILAYTGRTLDQLVRSSDLAVKRCLEAIDILVDGPYVEALNDGQGWRGSSNQIVHALGPRSTGAAEGAVAQRRVELTVSAEGRVAFTGIPRRGHGRSIAQRLADCERPTGAENTT
jgi:anaerobic ribonucleoside-triphosphate reductase activating protein